MAIERINIFDENGKKVYPKTVIDAIVDADGGLNLSKIISDLEGKAQTSTDNITGIKRDISEVVDELKAAKVDSDQYEYATIGDRIDSVDDKINIINGDDNTVGSIRHAVKEAIADIDIELPDDLVNNDKFDSTTNELRQHISDIHDAYTQADEDIMNQINVINGDDTMTGSIRYIVKEAIADIDIDIGDMDDFVDKDTFNTATNELTQSITSINNAYTQADEDILEQINNMDQTVTNNANKLSTIHEQVADIKNNMSTEIDSAVDEKIDGLLDDLFEEIGAEKIQNLFKK